MEPLFATVFAVTFAISLGVFGIYYLITKRREKLGKPRNSFLQLFFAAIGAGVALFSGGCGLAFLIDDLQRPSGQHDYVSWEIIAVLSLPPFFIGALIWWLAIRKRSKV
jgi:cytochrome bd-type quinol oxidase subunit 2